MAFQIEAHQNCSYKHRKSLVKIKITCSNVDVVVVYTNCANEVSIVSS